MRLWRPALAPVFLVITVNIAAAAETYLPLSAEQMHNLGIAVARPRPVASTGVVSALARVVVPPARETLITSLSAGTVTSVAVAEGDTVSRGQLLLTIRSPGYLVMQNEFLSAANGRALARAQYERERKLFEEGIIAERRWQEAEKHLQEAETLFDSRRQVLVMAGLSEQRIDELARTRRLQDEIRITSPLGGVVLERRVMLGERVEDSSPLFRIADLSVLWLDIQVPQERIEQIRTGMQAVIDGAQDKHAEIFLIGQSVDAATQSVLVRAEMDSPGKTIRPGKMVSVTIIGPAGDAAGEVLALPASAIARIGQDSHVFVRTAEGFSLRAVTTHGTFADEVHVSGDLSGEDQVAVTGIAALKALWLSREGERH